MVCAGCGSILAGHPGAGLHYCEDCGIAYRGAAQRLEFDLCSLSRALGLTASAVSLSHDPAQKPYDFYLSFHGSNAALAARVGQILEAAGYSVMPAADGATFVSALHEGLRNSRRILALVTPEYERSQYGGREWQSLLQQQMDGRNRILVTVTVAPRQDQAPGWEQEVLRAAVPAMAERATLWHYGEAKSEPAYIAAEERKSSSPLGFVPLMALLGMAALLVLAPAAVPVAMSTDLELPWRWMLYGGNVREHSIVERDSHALAAWEGMRGAAATLGHAKQWLELRDTALLRPSQWARDGIAQYSLAFDKGGVYLLTRAADGGDVRYETRLEFAGPGQIKVLVSRCKGRQSTPIRHGRIAPVEVATRTRHDVAISMQGDLHTLWLNGRAITTFQDPHLAAGAVGLRVDRSDQVRLFRWSLNVDAAPDYSATPSIIPRFWAAASPAMRKWQFHAEDPTSSIQPY